jgi:predicted ABC-type ATPase
MTPYHGLFNIASAHREALVIDVKGVALAVKVKGFANCVNLESCAFQQVVKPVWNRTGQIRSEAFANTHDAAHVSLICVNADTRAAELNAGSFHGISKGISSQVNIEFQRWILDHISARKSFAIETTLRSEVTFEQAQLAREHGFRTVMYFITPGSVEECVRRIKARAYRGGHSASETLVREIFHKSARNLLAALDFHSSGMDRVEGIDAKFSDRKTRCFAAAGRAGNYDHPRTGQVSPRSRGSRPSAYLRGARSLAGCHEHR